MAEATIESRVRALEDIEAIRDLKYRYFFCCDSKDPAGMRTCFADGPVHIDYGVVGVFDRADALVKVYTEIACHPYMVEMHHGANPQIALTDETHARGSWALHYVLINTQTATLTQLGGYYVDEYVKTAAGWKIARTRFVVSSTLAMDITAGDAKTLFAGASPPAA